MSFVDEMAPKGHALFPYRGTVGVRVGRVVDRWRKATEISSDLATRCRREAEIERFAGRQLRLIGGHQLAYIGVPASTVRSRVAARRLFRIHPGAFATVPPPYSQEQLWLAAVLACGPGAMLSDLPAASHWDIADELPRLAPHVTVVGARGRSCAGITVHRRGPVDPRDFAIKGQIPLTAVHLTLIHLAPHFTASELEVMTVAAESLGLLKRGRLGELVAERQGRPGVHKLLPLLALEPRMTKSKFELLFIPVVEAAGLPRPLLNHPIRVPDRTEPLIVDAFWPNIRFVVELDSQRFHGDWERAAIDRERDQDLAIAGRQCQRFVRRVVAEDPAGTARRLRLLYEARRGEVEDSGIE